jgi:hypothetical protein
LDKSPELTKTNQESEEETKQKIELPVKSTCSADNKIAKIELDNSIMFFKEAKNYYRDVFKELSQHLFEISIMIKTMKSKTI